MKINYWFGILSDNLSVPPIVGSP